MTTTDKTIYHNNLRSNFKNKVTKDDKQILINRNDILPFSDKNHETEIEPNEWLPMLKKVLNYVNNVTTNNLPQRLIKCKEIPFELGVLKES